MYVRGLILLTISLSAEGERTHGIRAQIIEKGKKGGVGLDGAAAGRESRFWEENSHA